MNIMRRVILHTFQPFKVSLKFFNSLGISLIRAIFGIEREFDRYYLRLKNSLKGNMPYLNDKNLIEYALKRTTIKEFAWDE